MNKIKRILPLALCAVLLFGNAFPAAAQEEINIYVSANAAGTGDGSKEHPFATIDEAREYVRTINSDMKCDINVNIAKGEYRLSQTLSFDDKDSGTNGYYVNYKGEEGTQVLGSVPVSGWKKEGNLYTAAYEGDYVRSIYINGKRATRATNEVHYVVADMYKDGDPEYEFDGIIVEGRDFINYRNKSDIQLHFALSWISSLNNVKDIIPMPEDETKSVILMEQPAFQGRATHGLPVRQYIKFQMENAFEELDTEGEFYFDRAEKKLYYMPRAGENMETAKVEVPAIEEILRISGSNSNNRVKNISFTSITFEYCAYARPAKYGLELTQANHIYGRNEEDKMEITPAAISFNWAEKIRFCDNIVRNVESVGIGFYQGVKLSKISGNVFEEIMDSAITVGFPSQPQDSPIMEYKNLAASKPATASGWDKDFEPEKAVDDGGGGWSGKGAPMWWQVDLQDEYRIDKIEIEPRSYLDQPVTRMNFQILGSNDPAFKEFTVLATQGSTPFDLKETAEYYIADEGKYRYVRVQKTDGGYMFLTEVRIINEDIPFEAARETCANNMISNNYITAAATENWSAPAICAYYVNNLSIVHNEISNVTYSGVSIGWGWGNTNSEKCRDNVVSFNYIHDHALRCFDAGAIYTLGSQPNSVEEGNYVCDQGNHLAGLYSDNGTKNYTIMNNVAENTGYATFINSGSGDLVHKNNYTTDLFRYPSVDYIYEEPQYYIPGNPSLEALDIMKNAGLEEKYKDIKKKSVTDFKVTDEQKLANAEGITASTVPTLSVNSYATQYIGSMLEASGKYLPLVEIGDAICQYPQEAVDKYKAVIESARNAIRASDLTAAKVTEAKIAFDKGYREFLDSSNMLGDDELISYAEKLLDTYKIGQGIGNVSQKAYDEFKKVINEYKTKQKPFGKIDKQWLQRYCERYVDNTINLDISAFGIEGQLDKTVIDEEKGEISLTVKYGRDRRALVPSIEYNEGVDISPRNGARADFSNPVTYTLSTKDGSSTKQYKVSVNYPERIDGTADMGRFIQDKSSWNETGSSTMCGFYKNAVFGDAEMEFDMSVEEGSNGQWVGLMLRNQDFNQTFEGTQDNACYVIVFTGSVVELHRFNNGVRTQFYGDVGGIEQLCGGGIQTSAFKLDAPNKIKVSTVNKDDGVQITLTVNGEQIFDVFDNYEGKITQPGYFGTASSRPVITLSAE